MTPLSAIAALEQCMAHRDYAGAVKLISRPETLAGLTAVTAPFWETAAHAAYRESVAAWRAEHETAQQQRQALDIAELVAVLAELFPPEALERTPA